ncbi:hypothetical protein F5Y01DRAFT_23138 [Xylaria sp. FL0043]|nr:hypothetical protein F5Y01DRAFT_23138 [Xylaria sp. FL0043]
MPSNSPSLPVTPLVISCEELSVKREPNMIPEASFGPSSFSKRQRESVVWNIAFSKTFSSSPGIARPTSQTGSMSSKQSRIGEQLIEAKTDVADTNQMFREFEAHVQATVYNHYDMTIAMLNKSMGLCLR